jgi:predicted component of type VI protein secretion system
MFKADGTRRDFPLKPGSLVVGRKNSCELRIPLSSVSRQHCEVTLEGDTLKLRDLGSSNGTYHNSIRVQEAELEAGDEIVVGPVVFTVVVDGVPGDIKPVRTIVDGSSPPAPTDPGGSAATIVPPDRDGDDDALSADQIDDLLSDRDDGSDSATLDLNDLDDERSDSPTLNLDDDGERLTKAGKSGPAKQAASSSDDSSVLDFDFDFDDLTDDDDK